VLLLSSKKRILSNVKYNKIFINYFIIFLFHTCVNENLSHTETISDRPLSGLMQCVNFNKERIVLVYYTAYGV